MTSGAYLQDAQSSNYPPHVESEFRFRTVD